MRISDEKKPDGRIPLSARIRVLPVLPELLISFFAVFFVPALPARGQGPPEEGGQTHIAIDLEGALARARENSPQLASAGLDVELAREDRKQAKATLLPSLDYFNQYIHTQGNGTDSGIFIANDGVHVYSSQAAVHQELFSPGKLAEYRRTAAAESLEEAKREIVARGLTGTVVESYYTAVKAKRASDNARQSLDEAQQFESITEKLEQGGEVARADVLKAQLVLEQRRRDLDEARLASEKARIALAVLLFPDYRLDFDLVDDLDTIKPLVPYDEVEAQARDRSPELRAARETVRQQEYRIKIAQAAYLPSLSLDYFFGINNNQFAAHDRDGLNRLGSSAQATLDLPVWNWFSTRSKVRQAELGRRQAELELAFARRNLISHLHSLYIEARDSMTRLDSLRRSLDFAGESLRLTTLRYQAGEATVLEVVDAQATLAGARNDYDEGLARYRLALVSIQNLTGNL